MGTKYYKNDDPELGDTCVLPEAEMRSRLIELAAEWDCDFDELWARVYECDVNGQRPERPRSLRSRR